MFDTHPVRGLVRRLVPRSARLRERATAKTALSRAKIREKLKSPAIRTVRFSEESPWPEGRNRVLEGMEKTETDLEEMGMGMANRKSVTRWWDLDTSRR